MKVAVIGGGWAGLAAAAELAAAGAQVCVFEAARQ
ncbi:MAG TPA: FAD-dependent oxidoreductase, partial [Accumulibacter sp.]|nr:FAD-dependent oxidoreductase [Accumulibacter sp.]